MHDFKLFEGRNLVIATKHEKEKVIAPIFEKELGVKWFTVSNLDTDQLGTFTGEVERKDDPITTARKKCLLAMELADCDMAVASEGSFGMHPSIFFATTNEEILLFIDKKNDLEVLVREISMETNFNASEIKTNEELQSFAKNANFPSHGLILRKSKDDYSEIVKGISDFEQLINSFNHFRLKYGTPYIETDMRAMHNPTRLKVIEKATKKLAEKINTLCPECHTPGFGISDAKKGLQCELCNFPTKSVLSYIYECRKCSFKKEDKYPNNKFTEDPTYCDFCNP